MVESVGAIRYTMEQNTSLPGTLVVGDFKNNRTPTNSKPKLSAPNWNALNSAASYAKRARWSASYVRKIWQTRSDTNCDGLY
ncbi:hypothetical protein ANO14919_027790 [Xylariales sp. No.14919]|nr:hypothetical protein ANO14919_027790 [Xylariales sp. No.14919]